MRRLTSLVFALLLLVPVLVGGCAEQEEEPISPEPPVEEPASPEEPLTPPENGIDWREADQLEPEKTTTLIIEGMEEEIVLQLQVSSLYPYALYLDEERYRMEEKEDKDYILLQTEGDLEVFMSIWHRENVEVSGLLAEIETELKEVYTDVDVHGRVESPLPAQYLYAASGDAWDDTVERYYLVEDFEGGVFVIRQKMFKEAVEGHGVRFDGILEEFYIWDSVENEFLQP